MYWSSKMSPLLDDGVESNRIAPSYRVIERGNERGGGK